MTQTQPDETEQMAGSTTFSVYADSHGPDGRCVFAVLDEEDPSTPRYLHDHIEQEITHADWHASLEAGDKVEPAGTVSWDDQGDSTVTVDDDAQVTA